jgi:hypothetical protein
VNNNTGKLRSTFKIAKEENITVFVFHTTISNMIKLANEGSLESFNALNNYVRTSVLTTVGFENSGADWLEQYKKHIEPVIVTSPQSIWNQMIWPYN